MKDIYRSTGKLRTLHQYLRKELEIKEKTTDP